MNRLKLIIVLLPVLLLVSCDALLYMDYALVNKSRKDIKLFIPQFPVDGLPKYLGHSKDTILILKPGQAISVAIGSKIDFPWATRNIYRRTPGICGIQRLEADTTINLGCSRSEWKYKNGTSILKLK